MHLAIDGDLILEISATDSGPTPDHITTRSLEDTKRHADEALQSFSHLIARGFGSTATRDTLAAAIMTSTTDFSVGSEIAAATRDQRRLEFLTECSVIDYYEKAYRNHPRPDQYTITPGEGSSLRISAMEDIAEDVAAALLGDPRGPRPTRRSVLSLATSINTVLGYQHANPGRLRRRDRGVQKNADMARGNRAWDRCRHRLCTHHGEDGAEQARPRRR